MYSFSFVMFCHVMSDMVIYGHIWAYMSIYDTIWTYTNGYEWMTCLQIVATHAFLKTAELEAFRCPFSSICETRTAPTKICQVRRHTKHIKTCLLCISKLMSAEKTCKKWLNHLQKSSSHQTSMGVLSVLSILSILRPSWSCLSSLFRLLNNSRERSNHKQSQVFFCGQYCLLLWSVMSFYIMPDFVDDPPKFYLCDLWGKM